MRAVVQVAQNDLLAIMGWRRDSLRSMRELSPGHKSTLVILDDVLQWLIVIFFFASFLCDSLILGPSLEPAACALLWLWRPELIFNLVVNLVLIK